MNGLLAGSNQAPCPLATCRVHLITSGVTGPIGTGRPNRFIDSFGEIMKLESARRASATLAAVTAAALIVLAGAGPAHATTCTAGTYYKITGPSAGYCAKNPPGVQGPHLSGPGWAIFTNDPFVGSTLKADKVSGWAKGTTLKYRWLRNGIPISGAWHSTYKVRTADRGRTVSVRVTGTIGGSKTSMIVSPHKIP